MPLARLRREVEPVEPAAYGRFLSDWQGLLEPREGRVALYLAEHEPLLARPSAPAGGDLHARIRERLERHGVVTREAVQAEGIPGGLSAALADLVERGRRRGLLIARIDGSDAAAHPYGAWLAEAGFVRGARGYVRRRGAHAHEFLSPGRKL